MPRRSIALLALALVLVAVAWLPWPITPVGSQAAAPAPVATGLAVAADAAGATPSDTAVIVVPPSLPAPPATAGPTRAPAETGRSLFVAKGCTTCHMHSAVSGSGGYNIGPALSTYEPDPDFVRQWLANPAAVRPGTAMPNLGLDPDEIEALLAFLAEE